ncbi:hypothetical protein QAD02_013285 [Eretmocerus hayati]|uniref:Uncharacterized protein n=1 Tax=Eretmocerus hayati TaxID=131215 RepID=A0ACC2P1Z7_9HYME|nr:hypothetical protein QAD02_013285 [Eretmocerus hayati]
MKNDERNIPMLEEDVWMAKLLTPPCADPDCNWCKLQEAKKLAIRGALRYKPGTDNPPVADSDEEAIDLSVPKAQEEPEARIDSTQENTDSTITACQENIISNAGNTKEEDITSTPASPSPSESVTPDSSSSLE